MSTGCTSPPPVVDHEDFYTLAHKTFRKGLQEISERYIQPTPVSDIAIEGFVNLSVYDINGRLINTLVDNALDAGYHTISWEAVDRSGLPLSNGIYFYRMITPQYTDVKKMLLIK